MRLLYATGDGALPGFINWRCLVEEESFRGEAQACTSKLVEAPCDCQWPQIPCRHEAAGWSCGGNWIFYRGVTLLLYPRVPPEWWFQFNTLLRPHVDDLLLHHLDLQITFTCILSPTRTLSTISCWSEHCCSLFVAKHHRRACNHSSFLVYRHRINPYLLNRNRRRVGL